MERCSLTAVQLTGLRSGPGHIHDISLALLPGRLTVVTAPDERRRRLLLRLLGGAGAIASGALVYRGTDQHVDLATACARDVATVRARAIVNSANLPTPRPCQTAEQAVAEAAHTTVRGAGTELRALGHGHVIGRMTGELDGPDRAVLMIAAVLLHPAPIGLIDLTNLGDGLSRAWPRIEFRLDTGRSILAVTDAVCDGLPEHAETLLLTADGTLRSTSLAAEPIAP